MVKKAFVESAAAKAQRRLLCRVALCGLALACLSAPACVQQRHISIAASPRRDSQTRDPQTPVVAPAPKAQRASVLFVSPYGAEGVDLQYLRELASQGFEVDYTDRLDELTRDRIRHYNVLVLFVTPDSLEVCDNQNSSSPARNESFVSIVEEFVQNGGGVLLMPGEMNIRMQRLAALTDRWGARLPAERIIENNPNNVASMPHSAHATRLAFTDDIATSPVSNGVRSLWYPYEPTYLASMTNPLIVDDRWQVVVRASATATTSPIDTHRSDAAPGLITRATPEPRPPLMAIRTLGAGRVALIAEWPQFSVGSGTKWIFDRDVLERGLSGRPSDFGKLLSNTLGWLSVPSLESAALGGWTMPPDRLQAPNAAPAIKAQYAAPALAYDRAALGHVELPPGRKFFRGLLGAKSSYSSGSGSVADYARAAREAGLDFVVFLEDFDHLSKEKLAALASDCARSSGPDLLLLPGFAVESNIGNHLFFFSPHPEWPPDEVLTGPHHNLLYVQEQNSKGEFTGFLTPFFTWVANAYHPYKGQVGYYDFADSPHGMRLYDARLYSMVGLRFYRNGKSVEDLTDAYLLSAASTIAPTPVSVEEVSSPEDLVREARRGHAMTYAAGSSLDADASDGVFRTALRWAHQYDGVPVFVSSGPKILSWPACFRSATYGAEGFAPERAAMESPLVVTSEVGLDEIRIYNGPDLFRRFALDGARTFEQKLMLDGTVQRNLVVVARDRRGGVAVSVARRSWADGALAPVFCSDHINDCHWLLLAHGPWSQALSNAPRLSLDVAGPTWDGGPPAAISALGLQLSLPEVARDEGPAEGARLDPIPVLELSDEGAVGVDSWRREEYDARLLQVVNPWQTFGPVGGPARVFDNTQRYRQWVRATRGPPAIGWPGEAVGMGPSPSLFTDTLRFRRATRVRGMTLARFRPERDASLFLATRNGSRQVALGDAAGQVFPLAPGEWFGVFGQRLMNAHLFANRGGALQVRIGATLDVVADGVDRQFRSGEEYTFELSGMAFPLDAPIADEQELARYVGYIRAPSGLELLRGKRRESPGLLDVAVDDGAVELSIPKTEEAEGFTIPVRVLGLNRRWSAALLQKEGYTAGFYGPGHDRFRSLATDFDGVAYVPLYVDRAPLTRILAGHPIVADARGGDLFIQVTCLGGTPFSWHISVNNPEAHSVTTVLSQAMTLPGLHFVDRQITVAAGGYVVLQ